jgi:hypothetical protein
VGQFEILQDAIVPIRSIKGHQLDPLLHSDLALAFGEALVVDAAHKRVFNLDVIALA